MRMLDNESAVFSIGSIPVALVMQIAKLRAAQTMLLRFMLCVLSMSKHKLRAISSLICPGAMASTKAN